jgi:hypothetical protein
MSKLRPSDYGVAEAPDSPTIPTDPLELPNSPKAITIWTYGSVCFLPSHCTLSTGF